ncbi:MAG: phosphoribosylamine--glycine ligase, partial [Planctomycetaceae bacterium]|nr:phosphoribosylamine--glycine ligase [Planctomycetaceae bacterium]
MKVLVIGQGGREHALVWKLAQSASVDEVFCAPGNAGTGEDGTNVDISGTDATRLVKFAKDNQIGLTVVGPEVPLMAGVADAFLDAGLPVFGPRAAAAELEGSKVFSKQLMQHANVPTADFQVFKHADAAQSYLQDREATSFVVKA